MENNFTVLFDFDSMVYKAVYKIVSISKIRSWLRASRTREWMEQEIMNLTLNRLMQMSDGILLEIEDTEINIESVEYFLTVCPESVRKTASPIYKANRKKNKWVSMVRKELVAMDGFIFNEKWEADDLIKDRAVEIGDGRYLICSIDKDLKQIDGLHFDYYRPRSNELNEKGFRKVLPCRGLEIVSPEQAHKFFWKQMLMGDSGDNIKGIPRIGKVKAEKILSEVNPEEYEGVVRNEYVKYFGIDWLHHYSLHKLLIGLGVNHRP